MTSKLSPCFRDCLEAALKKPSTSRFGRNNLFCQGYFGFTGLKARFRSAVCLFGLHIKIIFKYCMNMFPLKIMKCNCAFWSQLIAVTFKTRAFICLFSPSAHLITHSYSWRNRKCTASLPSEQKWNNQGRLL